MKNLSATESAFMMGFLAGLKQYKYSRPSQIRVRFPHFSEEMVECYLNGEEDGIKRDSYRYDLIRRGLQTISLNVRTNDADYEPTLSRIFYNVTCEAAVDYPESASTLRAFTAFQDSNPCFMSHNVNKYIGSCESWQRQELAHAEIAAQGGY